MKLTQMTLSMSVAAMALGPVPMASAQEQAAANAGQEDAENVLDSVVVTATKRSESQQDVGLTVAAFAVELGFKTDWPRQSLRLNGAVFYYDRRDVQASGIDESGIVPIARLTNIGDVEVYGAELEAVWAPIRQLTLQGGLSWLENEIVSSDKIPGNLFNSPEPATFVGARLPNQPELSANMVARYEEYVSARMLAGLQITYTYRGEQDLGLVVFPEEGSLMTEDAYQLVNLKASIGPDDNKWRLSAYVENLFDEVYRNNAGGGAPGGFQEIYGAPQIFGVGLDLSF